MPQTNQDKKDNKEETKNKESLTFSVKKSTKREEKTKVIPTKRGTTYQNPTTGQYKKRPSAASVNKQSPKIEIKPKLELNKTIEYEKGNSKVKANAKLDFANRSVGLDVEAKQKLGSTNLGPVKIDADLASFKAESSVDKSGISVGGELKGPTATASVSGETCISTDKYTGTVEVAIGPQIGRKLTIGRVKNKSNEKKRTLLGVGFSRGYGGVKFNVDRSENDPDCVEETPKLKENTLIDTNYETAPLQRDAANTTASNEFLAPAIASNNNRSPASITPNIEQSSPRQIPPTEEQQQAEAEDHLRNIGLTDEEAHQVVNEALAEGFELEDVVENTANVYRSLQQRHENNHQQLIQDFNQCLDFVQDLAAKTGCKPLGQISTIIKSGIVIYEAVNKLSNILSGAIQGSVLGPIGMIGGAVMNIVGLFMNSGPDPTELILGRLNDISQQITDLHTAMDKYFEQNFKNQVQILEAIHKGFDQLERQLDARISEVRTELRNSLATLQDSMDFAIELQNVNAREQLLIPFKKLCESAKDCLKGINDGQLLGKRIPKLCSKLTHSAVIDSTASSLTGGSFWLAQAFNLNARLVNQHLLKIRFNKNSSVYIKNVSQSLNSALGFLGYYAQQYSAVRKPEGLANAYLWYMALDNYIPLNHLYADFDHDPENAQLGEIIAVGEHGLNFINQIATDAVFWQSLIANYYESLQNVKQHIVGYANAKSKELRDEKNRTYSEHERDKDADTRQGQIVDNLWGIAQLDLLASPEQLIAHFDARTLNNIGAITTDANNIASDFVGHQRAPVALNSLGNLTNKKPFYQIVSAHRELLPNNYLCAEYLGLIGFNATQSGTIEGISWKNPIPVPKEGGHNMLEGYNVCKGNTITVPDPPVPNSDINPNVNWHLPLKITMSNGQPLINLKYQGNWTNLPGVRIGAYHTNDVTVGNYAMCLHAFSSGAEEAKYGNHLVTFIHDYWNNPNDRSLNAISHTTTINQQLATNLQVEANITTAINAFYFNKRKHIALDLLDKNGGHEEQQNFHKVLAKLDMDVKLLQWYAILVGKNIANTPLDDLLTSEEIESELQAYSELEAVDLTRKLAPELWEILETFESNAANLIANSSQPLQLTGTNQTPKTSTESSLITTNEQSDLSELNYTAIENISDFELKKLSSFHPLRLFTAGLAQLEAYKSWKLLRLQKFPELSRYTNTEEYELKCMLQREELLKNETYEFFRELNAERFNDAKHKVLHFLEYFADIPISEYTQMYMETTRWALQKSQSDIVTGNLATDIEDLLDLKNHQRVIHSLRRGWEVNIGYLMQLANKIADCQFAGKKPINFTMWADGFVSFLRLIYNDKLRFVAKTAKNTTLGQLNTLVDLAAVGHNLKNIIYTICCSKTLFDYLFTRYLADLKELETTFITKKNVSNSERVILRATKEEAIWNRLDVYALIFRAYLEILFGYEIEADANFKKKLDIKDKEQLFDHLETAINTQGGRKNMLIGQLQHYRNVITNLQEITQRKIAAAHELFIFWEYLQTYFVQNWPCTTLKITGAELLTSGLTVPKVSMLDEFLSIHSFIDSIEIENINLSTSHEAMVILLTTLKKYPQIKMLQVLNCVIDSQISEAITTDFPNALITSTNDIIESHNVQNIAASLQSIFVKVDRHPKTQIFLSPIFAGDKKNPPRYQLTLNLQIGPPMLDYLFALGKKAQQGLQQRWHLEQSGVDLDFENQTETKKDVKSKHQFQHASESEFTQMQDVKSIADSQKAHKTDIKKRIKVAEKQIRLNAKKQDLESIEPPAQESKQLSSDVQQPLLNARASFWNKPQESVPSVLNDVTQVQSTSITQTSQTDENPIDAEQEQIQRNYQEFVTKTQDSKPILEDDLSDLLDEDEEGEESDSSIQFIS